MKLWTSLLFLEGVVADATLARALAGEPADPDAPEATAAPHIAAVPEPERAIRSFGIALR